MPPRRHQTGRQRSRAAGFNAPLAAALAAVALAITPHTFAQEPAVDTPPLPELRRAEPVTQLYADGRPFLALGGELGNSTASDLAVLDHALETCRALNLNTVMLPVYWDLIEPAEGDYDFSLVQGALDRARARGLRLVLLWFGTWKNSMSSYAPGWVKRDTDRFQRARTPDGRAHEVITAHSTDANDADARAFARLMRWLAEYDRDHRTVLMVQVENEIGMIPLARDHSPLAEAAYRRPVPDELMAPLTRGELGPELTALWESAGRKTAGTWAEVFGDGPEGQEVFSAWHFARYTQRVAEAGRAEYPLPLFANAALIRPGYRPGEYPAGGPLPHLMELWRTAAPALDMICPDIYFPNFMDWAQRYTRGGNPLFVPEMAPSMRAAANAVYAVGALGAIGVGPFAIEGVTGEKARLIAEAYGLMAPIADRILKAQHEGGVIGLSPQVGFDWQTGDEPQRGELGGVVFETRFDRPEAEGDAELTDLPTLGVGRWEAPPGVPLGGAMILQLGPEAFVILGMGVVVTFHPADGQGQVGIDRAQEGRFDADGQWVGGRWLGGDQTHQGRHLHLYGGRWTMQRVTLYRY